MTQLTLAEHIAQDPDGRGYASMMPGQIEKSLNMVRSEVLVDRDTISRADLTGILFAHNAIMPILAEVERFNLPDGASIAAAPNEAFVAAREAQFLLYPSQSSIDAAPPGAIERLIADLETHDLISDTAAAAVRAARQRPGTDGEFHGFGVVSRADVENALADNAQQGSP